MNFDDFSDMRTYLLAPLWKIWLARLFGQKVCAIEGRFLYTSYRWRGVLYVWRVDQL